MTHHQAIQELYDKFDEFKGQVRKSKIMNTIRTIGLCVFTIIVCYNSWLLYKKNELIDQQTIVIEAHNIISLKQNALLDKNRIVQEQHLMIQDSVKKSMHELLELYREDHGQ